MIVNILVVVIINNDNNGQHLAIIKIAIIVGGLRGQEAQQGLVRGAQGRVGPSQVAEVLHMRNLLSWLRPGWLEIT